jgi:hypothetical protein
VPRTRDLVGRWRLVDYRAASDGKTLYPMGEGARGVLDYSADGKVSVHIMARDGRYFAYYGDYIVDEAAATVTHRLELASDPTFVGASNLRHASLKGDTLVLSGAMTIEGRPATIHVTWQRCEIGL